MIMIIWFVFGLYTNWPEGNNRPWGLGAHALLFILFFIVGWALFGFVIQ